MITRSKSYLKWSYFQFDSSLRAEAWIHMNTQRRGNSFTSKNECWIWWTQAIDSPSISLEWVHLLNTNDWMLSWVIQRKTPKYQTTSDLQYFFASRQKALIQALNKKYLHALRDDFIYIQPSCIKMRVRDLKRIALHVLQGNSMFKLNVLKSMQAILNNPHGLWRSTENIKLMYEDVVWVRTE